LPSTGVLPVLTRSLALAVEVPTIIALVAEVVVLFCGVMARYAFHRPLIWSDELASIIFLWLAMFGAAIAVQRGGHMRLSYLMDRLPPAGRAIAEVLQLGVPLLLAALLFSASLDYADDQSFIETPALGWSGLVRAAAMPTGLGIVGLSAALELLRHRPRDLAAGAAVLGAVAVVLWLAAPLLHGIGNWNLMVFFVLLLGAGVLSGLPIAFCFALATIAYLMTTTSTPLSIVVGRMDEGMSSLILLAVPLFVLLGQLMDMTGLARVLVAFLAALVGHVRAGLSYVLIGAILLVSGISGSKTADMAAVAPVLFPEMKRRGVNEGELIALLAASGAMSETIPPSIVLIVIGSVTSVSIAGLFTAGLLPGIFLALVLALMARRSAGPESLADSCAAATLRHSRRGGRGRCDGDGGLNDRCRLHDRRRHPGLPPVSVATHLSHADRHGGAVRRHPADHRGRHRHGLGADAVGILASAGWFYEQLARRQMELPGHFYRRLHRVGQRPRGHSRNGAVRPAAVSCGEELGRE
jgi:TRAP-type C4-dicarboxylate transport system permease small subunit